MKTVIGRVIFFLGATSAFATGAAEQQTVTPTQHYVFTYNFKKPVDAIEYQNQWLAQNFQYQLTVAIQQTVHDNLALLLTEKSLQEPLMLASISEDRMLTE